MLSIIISITTKTRKYFYIDAHGRWILSAVNPQDNLLSKAEFITYSSYTGQDFITLRKSRRRRWPGGGGEVNIELGIWAAVVKEGLSLWEPAWSSACFMM